MIMINNLTNLILILILLTGCSETQNLPLNSSKMITAQEINGRNKEAVYRAKIPSDWIRKDPLPNDLITDTTKPISEFFIPGENQQQIRITIHNFPTERPEDRIPPEAQIARWKRQFSRLDPSSVQITPQAYSGFSGFLFEGSGLITDAYTAMIGWAMQLAPEHFSVLSAKIQMSPPQEAQDLYQMRSDFTIKATGPKLLMEKHRRDIINFATSFELIHEIPEKV